jgi:hypothetical protein
MQQIINSKESEPINPDPFSFGDCITKLHELQELVNILLAKVSQPEPSCNYEYKFTQGTHHHA